MFHHIIRLSKSINFRLRYLLIPFILISFLLTNFAHADSYDDEILQPRYINQLTIPLQTWALEFNFSNYEGHEWFGVNEMAGSVDLYNKSDHTNLDITATRDIKNASDNTCFNYFLELNKNKNNLLYFGAFESADMPYFEYSKMANNNESDNHIVIGTGFAVENACVQVLVSDWDNIIFYNNRLKYLKKVLSNLKINSNYQQTIYDILKYGNHYFYRRNYELASKYLNNVLNIEKTNPELNQKDFQALIINLNRSYIQLNDLKQAEDVLLLGIEKDPTNPLFYYDLAVVSTKKDDFNRTFKNLWKAYTYEENLSPFVSLPDPMKEKAFQKYADEGRFIEYLYSLNKRHSIIMIEIDRNYSVIRNAFEDEYNAFNIIRIEDGNGSQYHLDQFGNRFYKENYKLVTNFSGYGYNLYDINAYAENYQGKYIRLDTNGNITETNDSWRYGENVASDNIEYIDGIAVVYNEKEKYHIDTEGNRLYEENYIAIDLFKDGIAPVRDGDGLYFYIDTNGKSIFDTKFESKIWPFYQDRARITDQFTGSYHINRDGKRLYSESYDFVDHFYEDRAKVRDFYDNYFHIDLNGKRVYPENYVWVNKYSEGTARVKDELGNWYHIDKFGKELYTEKYDWVGNFIDGIAPVQNEEGIIKYIDSKGNFVQSPFLEK